MKKFKRILAVLLTAVMLISVISTGAVSAAEETAVQTGANFIQFNAKGWNNIKAVYAHIWVNSGKSFYPWGASANTACENVAGTVWKYDLSKLNASTELSGGIKSGKDYLVIFHADTKVQTYDLTLGTECFGDTAKITGKMVENPVDSEKEGYEAVWTKNTGKYGPHKALTSIGNLIGSKMCPNEDVIATLGDWVVLYATSQFCDPAKALAKGLKSYGVKDISAIYAYAKKKIEKGEGGLASVADVEKCLNDAYKIAYPNATQSTVDKEKYPIKVESIKIPSHYHGTVSLSRSATYYRKGYKDVVVCLKCDSVISHGKTIKKKAIKSSSYSFKGGKNKITVTYKKISSAKGFQIKVTNSDTSLVKKYDTTKSVKKSIPGLSKGTYKVKLRIYSKQNGKKVYSNWTDAKSITVR